MSTSGVKFWVSNNSLVRALRRQVSIHPALYIPLRRLRAPQTVVHPNTDLLIEGFPRCGNTWTEALLREASGDRLDLAHHSHAAAHVKQAVRLNVPTMILYREPDDAVASLLALNPGQRDAAGAFAEYDLFYRTLLPLRGSLVRFYSFSDVTTRPAEVIADLAEGFGLEMSADGLDSDAGKARVFARMDEKARRLKRRGTEHSKSKPTNDDAEAQARKAAARKAIENPKAAAARSRALEIYAQLKSDLPATPEVAANVG